MAVVALPAAETLFGQQASTMRGSLGIDVWALLMLMTRSPVESRLGAR
jgi:hypothetical protein